MANFLHHEACPACREAGGDRDGNNLGRYDDGSAWCFACGYWERKTGKKKLEKATKTAFKDFFTELATLPPAWEQELVKRGLNESERGLFTYSPEMDRLIYRNEDFLEARCFFGKKPKTLSFGTKPFVIFGEGTPVVLVEDLFSALRVGRTTSAIPLFGSVIKQEWYPLLTRLTKNVILWLDHDKYNEAIAQARKLRLTGLSSSVIRTPLDPKEYDETSIAGYLGTKR